MSQTVGILLVLAWATPAATAGASSESKPSGETTPALQPHATLPDARELLLTGAYEQAESMYADLARAEGAPVEAVLGLARCRAETGRYDDAIHGLSAASDRPTADWHSLTAGLYRIRGDYPKTLHHARAAIALDPGHAGAHLVLGQTLELLGRRDDAIEAYGWFDRQVADGGALRSDAAWLTDVAIGFVRYSELTRTHLVRRLRYALTEMLQIAYERVDSSYWPARVAAGNLLRRRYNNDPETGSTADYRAALKINEHIPAAHVGLGWIALGRWDFEEAEYRAKRALESNPSHPPALHLQARRLIDERRYKEAMEACKRALKVNANDPEALSLAAAARACRYDEASVARLVQQVHKLNPRCPLLHRTLGDALSGLRQYADSERHFLKAIAFEPTDANARTELGLMYMQWGREDLARDALDAAWALDPFNERTKFTLDLLDRLHQFARYETEHFIIRHDPNQDPGMGTYLADPLERLHVDVTGDYGVTLEDKTIIELFPSSRSFAVRITGKPWIHTIGACTGRVIALAAPRQGPGLNGPYNIINVLRHEFTHTVTLAATHNRIPHWFTEGLAVMQEDTPRSFEWQKLLAESVRRDDLFTLRSIDWGFMRPKEPADRPRAYAQSEWMCEYIVQRNGFDTIGHMLEHFRKGKTPAQTLETELHLTEDEFDRAFAVWAGRQAAGWPFDLEPPRDPEPLRRAVEADPSNAAIRGSLSRAEFDAGERDKALAAARRTLELAADNLDAMDVFVRILSSASADEPDEQRRRAYDEKALPVLKRLMQADPNNWRAADYLGEIMVRRGRWDEAVVAFTQLQQRCPRHPASWRALAGIHLRRGDTDHALAQLLELARLENDMTDVPGEIGQIYARRERLPDARFWLSRALNIDPYNIALHRKLAEVAMRMNDTQTALREWIMLTRIDPQQAQHWESAAVAAHKLGRTADAAAFARRAVELNPSSPAATIVDKPIDTKPQP